MPPSKKPELNIKIFYLSSFDLSFRFCFFSNSEWKGISSFSNIFLPNRDNFGFHTCWEEADLQACISEDLDVVGVLCIVWICFCKVTPQTATYWCWKQKSNILVETAVSQILFENGQKVIWLSNQLCRCCSSDTLIFQKKNCSSVQLCFRSNVYYIKGYKNSSLRCTCNEMHTSDLNFFWVNPLKMIIQLKATLWSCRNTAVLLWERWAAQLEFMLACWWNVSTAEVSHIFYKEKWKEKPKPLSCHLSASSMLQTFKDSPFYGYGHCFPFGQSVQV